MNMGGDGARSEEEEEVTLTQKMFSLMILQRPNAKYGCNEIIRSIKKRHKSCPPNAYSPCSCRDCIVVVSRGVAELYKHEKLGFVLNRPFQITLNLRDHKTLILHEDKLGLRFLLLKSSYHSWMTFNRMDSRAYDVDVEASILVPPQWEIDDETRELFESFGLSEEDFRELLANGDEKMRDEPATLDPRRIHIKLDLLTMNKDEVHAHLLQIPYFPNISSTPINIDISIKEKKMSDL